MLALIALTLISADVAPAPIIGPVAPKPIAPKPIAVRAVVTPIVADGGDYETAQKASLKTGRPLLVLVSTEWCPACQVMKKKTLPQVRADGALDEFIFTMVNPDHEAELSKILIGNGPIPELVLFRKVGKPDENLWTKQVVIGGQSVEAVKEFLKKK